MDHVDIVMVGHVDYVESKFTMEQVYWNANHVLFITLWCHMTSWGYINQIIMKVFFGHIMAS
jgi:hypothetical protein